MAGAVRDTPVTLATWQIEAHQRGGVRERGAKDERDPKPEPDVTLIVKATDRQSRPTGEC